MSQWEPDWVVAPAEILQEWMEEHGVSSRLLSRASGCTPEQIDAVLDRKPLGLDVADALARGTRIHRSVWLALEQMYRHGLAEGKTE